LKTMQDTKEDGKIFGIFKFIQFEVFLTILKFNRNSNELI